MGDTNGVSPCVCVQSVPSSSSVRPCVLLIGLDGCRPDCLTPSTAPTLCNLLTHPPGVDGRSTAFSLHSQVGDICWSGPGWTSAATGVWRDKHGVSGNTFPTQQFDHYPNMFQRLKTYDPTCITASCVNWKPLNEHILIPSDHPFTHEESDEQVLESTCRIIQEQERIDLLFVHLDDIDLAGHTFDYGAMTKRQPTRNEGDGQS